MTGRNFMRRQPQNFQSECHFILNLVDDTLMVIHTMSSGRSFAPMFLETNFTA